MASETTILQKLDKFPPFLVIALARDERGRRLSIEEVSKRSGISERKLFRLKDSLTWEREKVCVMESLCMACGINLLDTYKQCQYLKRSLSSGKPLRHLSRPRYRRVLILMEKCLNRESSGSSS